MSMLKELELARQELQDSEARWENAREGNADKYRREVEAARNRVRRLEKALEESGGKPPGTGGANDRD
ncbi:MULTISPECIES: hypothetical protein [Microbulbifer]|uniref:hypothetical protein n=1 Tax=Microbulbifer TaxID=48073 RepID=UPI001E3EBA02|nr:MULTISPECIES: hypothetical protein [Microbulbifer]UHQ56773.1 hypothetical protein LVE68_07320 [Microbulbifer sp. YPW16]